MGLPVSLSPYCGVDLITFYSKNSSAHSERCIRCIMGIKPSPCFTTQSMGWEEDFIRGYSCPCDNLFQWSNIRLNFPVDSKYSPSLSWVSNITKEGNLVADLWTYIDDIFFIVSSEEEG